MATGTFYMSAVVEVCVCHLFPKLALANGILTVLVKGGRIGSRFELKSLVKVLRNVTTFADYVLSGFL